jgi:small multidrug resistance family-3 protein
MVVMKMYLFVLVATIFEATGDAVIRVALHHAQLPARIGLFLVGAVLLTLYGTSLNLAPVEFATVTGSYVATLFVVFQITNYLFFRAVPTTPVMAGGVLIVAGGLIIALWR